MFYHFITALYNENVASHKTTCASDDLQQRPEKCVVDNECFVQFLSCIWLVCTEVSVAFMLYNVDADIFFSETAMQLIYCKCRSVSFWIYIFLYSISHFQHKGETKIDVLLSCLLKYFLMLQVPPNLIFNLFVYMMQISLFSKNQFTFLCACVHFLLIVIMLRFV